MDITEIIKKVKANLKTQEELKVQLENEEQSCEITKEKIDYKKTKLQQSQENEHFEFDDVVNELRENAESLKDNLPINMVLAYEELCEVSVFARFMGKDYRLFANDCTFSTMENPRDLQAGKFVDKLFKEYMLKGKMIFNENSFRTLLEIKNLYEIKPTVITSKLVGLDVDRKTTKLMNQLGYYKTELSKSDEDLKDVEIKISKTKEFKSEFLRKIFTKKAKLIEKRKNILHKNNNLSKNVKELEAKLEDKATIKAESTEYVKKELNALMGIFEWVASFEKAKIALINYRVQNVDSLMQEVQSLTEKLATTNTRIKEIKGLLKLNKQINNETVENALMSEDFITQLSRLDKSGIQKGEAKAVKFIENKYHDYLQGKVETLVK